MPRIPQYYGSEDIRTGSTGPQSDPAAFGAAGLEQVGQGLANLGGGLGDIAYRQKVAVERQRIENERLWLRTASTQLEKSFTDFNLNGENHTKESFGVDFDTFADKQIVEYSKNAPSPKAARFFQAHAQDITQSYRKFAYTTALKTRDSNSFRAFEEQTSSALHAYRTNVELGVADAEQLLSGTVNGIFDDIEDRFGGRRPDEAREAQEKLVRDVVLATAKNHPDFARKVLNDTNVVGETLRKSLLNHIEAETTTGTALARAQVDSMMDKALKEGQRGNIIPPMDEKLVKAVYGEDAGAARLLKFNEAAKVWNEANAIAAKLGDKNAGYQNQELAKLSQTADPDALRIVGQKLDDNQRQQQKDPAAFLRSKNDFVQRAYEDAMAKEPSLQAQYMNLAHSASLKYQGYPPLDASKEEAAKYLSLPEGQRHIMSAGQAKEMGARLAQGSISDQLKVIDEMLAGYDEEHQFVAFNDLVHYAEIPPALQLAHLNRGKTWLNEYINTALNKEILAKLTPEKQTEFAEHLDGNAQWNLFVRSLYADAQRIREVGAWRSGVIAYANALSFKGDKSKDATEKAFQRLVTDNLAFPTVHGEPIMVNKARKDGTLRTDPEIADCGRKLTTALRDVPPQHIKTEDDNGTPYFLTLPQLPENDPKRIQHLRDIITSTGFYRPSPDGQSVSLYLLDSDGVEFQARDKNNRPLEIDLDALPAFGTQRYSMFGQGGNFGLGGKTAVPDKISKTYSGTVEGWAPYWKNQRHPIPERIKELRAP